ncbi:Uncharacterised protein [Escherichia coli]|nr:Uncharacterised protein [Escherichia coli]STM42036.1 Uncharacterised protein [Escherichia coli]
MRKNYFIRIGFTFIITAALIAFINLASNFEVGNQLDRISSALPILFGLLGLIMTIYGFFLRRGNAKVHYIGLCRFHFCRFGRCGYSV